MNLINYICCPECKVKLQRSRMNFTCKVCDIEFPITSGIVNFALNRDYYYSPLPKQALNDILKDKSDSKATSSHGDDYLFKIIDEIKDGPRKEEWIENLVNENRASFKFLLSLRPDAHILNLGCGWDNTTINLARTVKHVTAMDLTLERLRVLEKKMNTYNISNIDLFCGGDRPYLPFLDQTFDAVILNGVLEWVASDWSKQIDKNRDKGKIGKAIAYLKSVLTDSNPENKQVAYLKEVTRVLKSDGQIFIGIENRTALEYFGKRVDHHSYIMFASLMPRFLAHLVSLIKSQHPYLTYTYTEKGYKRLLKRAGIDFVNFSTIEPDYRRPKYIVPLNNSAALKKHFNSNWAYSKRHYLPLSLYRQTVSSFGIVANKKGFTPSVVERLKNNILAINGIKKNDIVVEAIHTPRKNGVCVFFKANQTLPFKSASNVYVLKIPYNSDRDKSLYHNFIGLQMINTFLDNHPKLSSYKSFFPKAIKRGTFEKMNYYIESAISGIPWINSKASKNGNRIFLEVINFLSSINDCNCIRDSRNTTLFLNKIRKQVDFLIDRVSFFDNLFKDNMDNIYHFLACEIEGETFRPVFVKGDFALSNTIIDINSNRISGFIDFENLNNYGTPYTDIADFLFSFLRNFEGKSFGEVFSSIGTKENEFDLGSIVSTLAIRDIKVNRDQFIIGAIMAWLNHVSCGLQHDYHFYNKNWVYNNILNAARVVRQFVD